MSDSLQKLKPSRLKKELIPLIIISAISISSLVFFTYQDSVGSIAYTPEVPTVNIDISNEVTNLSQQCFIRFSPTSYEDKTTGWANRYLAADIRRRNSDGGFSFELYQNENLFQIRDDDDWLLLPPGKYLDSFRTKLAFEAYNMILNNTSTYRLPHSKLVEVYINENYQGLYLLSERIDRKMMDLNQEDVDFPNKNDMIFKATNWRGDFYTIPYDIDSQWDQLFPNMINFSYVPRTLTEYIHNVSEEEFFNKSNGIFSLFDETSIIDNLLYGLLTGHEILEGSSYYLVYKRDVSKFFCIPWDFSQSWGFYKHSTIPSNIWLSKSKNEINSVVWSKLYYRLLFPENDSINTGFITKVVNRWNYLYTNFWNSDNLISYFDEMYLPIQDTLVRATNDGNFVMNFASSIKNWIIIQCNLLSDILIEQSSCFSYNFKTPYQEDSEIFGFSSPEARRYYYKSSLLFSTKKIHEVNVVVQESYLSNMLGRKRDYNRFNDRLYMPSDISIDNYSMDDVGFRIRGNYNKIYPKDSFKFKFSETEFYLGDFMSRTIPENEGRRFLGLRRLNLRAAPVDFSFVNEVAGYAIFKLLGIPCTRLSWAKLFITETDANGNIIKPKEYKGLYLLTEDIDKTFLRYNFKNPEGNLYKTTDPPATLEYKDDLRSFFGWDGRRIYELRTNREQDDYSDLQEFVYSINYNWSNINRITNLSLIAKYFAASNFIGSWDDYAILPHNYFLYSDPTYGFVLIPWDIEHCLNMGYNSIYAIGAPDFRVAPIYSDYMGYYPQICEIFGFSASPRPLWTKSLNDLTYLDAYLNSHIKIVNNVTSLKAKLNVWFDFIRETVLIPFEFTDPEPHPDVEWWYPSQIPEAWFNIEINRVMTYLDGRKLFVQSELP